MQCIKDKDGIALCVYKHRPCNELEKYKQAIKEIAESIIEPHCKTCREQAINSDCDECIFGEITECINEVELKEVPDE